jgi:hypothetical protein
MIDFIIEQVLDKGLPYLIELVIVGLGLLGGFLADAYRKKLGEEKAEIAERRIDMARARLREAMTTKIHELLEDDASEETIADLTKEYLQKTMADTLETLKSKSEVTLEGAGDLVEGLAARIKAEVTNIAAERRLWDPAPVPAED